MATHATLFEKLFARVDRPSEDPEVCWDWTGARDKDGYGKIKWKGKDLKTHRVAFEECEGGGDIPEGMMVCHHCDRPPCCRPSHLYLGTAQDNMDDKMQKGRHVVPCSHQVGEANGGAALTEAQVREIFHLAWQGELTQREIGEMFRVGHTAVSPIKNGRNWKHLNLLLWHPPMAIDFIPSAQQQKDNADG